MTPARRGQGKVKKLAIASVVDKSRKLISPHWLTPLASALVNLMTTQVMLMIILCLYHDKKEQMVSGYTYRAEVEGFGAARLDSCLTVTRKDGDLSLMKLRTL